ncbi:putative DNA-directed RNA polymerase [Helianthus anomalus]
MLLIRKLFRNLTRDGGTQLRRKHWNLKLKAKTITSGLKYSVGSRTGVSQIKLTNWMRRYTGNATSASQLTLGNNMFCRNT